MPAYLVCFDGRNLVVLFDEIPDLYIGFSQREARDMVDMNGHSGDIRLDHCFNVPSDIDSAMVGTLTILSA